MKTPPAPPGEVVSAFFCFSFLFWGAFLTRCGLLFFVRFRPLQDSPLSRIPRSPTFPAVPLGGHPLELEAGIMGAFSFFGEVSIL